MRRIINILLCIFAISISMATITACSKVEVTGFEVPTTATAEIGNYYELPMPNIKANCKYSLEVSASKGGKQVFVVSNKVLVTDFSKYTITYTLSYDGKTEVKTTEVTPVDTTAPTIKFFDIETTLYTNTEYDLSGVIVDDNSLESLTASLSIKCLETNSDIAIVDNKFTTPSQKGLTLRVTGTATDSKGNVANQYKDFYVVDRDDYGVIDSFDSQEITAYTNSHAYTALRTTFDNVSSNDSGEIQGINGRALKMSFTEFKHSSIEAAFINFDTTKMKNIALFDYIKFRIYVDAGTATQDDISRVSLKAKDTGAPIYSNASGWIEYVVEKQYYAKSNNVILYISYWNDSPTYTADFTVYVDEIVGGYNKHAYVGDEINIVESLGLEDKDVTDITLKTTSNASITEGIFKAQVAGVYTLSVTVDKAPYKVTTFDFDITIAEHPSYDDFLGINELKDSKYLTQNNKGSVLTGIKKSIVDGSNIGVNDNVLKLDIAGSIQYGTFYFIMPSVDSEQLSKFDYYIIKGYVDVNRNGFRISPAISEVDGESIYKEISEKSLEDVKGYFEYKISKEYFGENLMFVLSDWTGTNPNERAKAVYLTSITGGYDDLSEVASINLVEHTGFSESQIQGSYFENDLGKQTEISNLTNFAFTESGKIVLVVNVDGYTTSNIEIVVKFYPAFNNLDNFNTSLDNYEVTQASNGNLIPAMPASYNSDGLFFNLLDTSQSSNLITFKHIPYSSYSKYDYITIKGNVDVTRNGFRISLYDNANSTEYTETIMADVKGDFTFVIDKKYFNKNYLQLFVGIWTGLTTEKVKSLTIYSITGGFGETGVGEEINLLTKTGLTSFDLENSYFENASGSKTPITNFANFVPTEKGKIVLVINAENYKVTNMEIPVVLYPKFNVLDTFDGDISANYFIAQRDTPTTIYPYAELSYENGGVKLDTTSMQQGNFFYNFKNVTKDKYSKFDYITITGNVDCTRDGFTITLRQGNNNANDKANIKGDFTYVIPKEYFTSDCFPNDYLRLHISLWTGTGSDKVKSMTIYSITGGYNSVYSDEEINLEEKFGLTSNELAGSYFENNSGVQTPITNFNEYTPTEAGKLVVIINAQGYASSTCEIEVIKTYAYNELETFSGDMTNYYIYDSNGTNKQGVLTTMTGSETGITALNSYDSLLKAEFTYKLAWGAHISIAFYDITKEILNKFDYITVTAYVDSDGGNVQVVSITNDSDERGAAILENQKGLITYTLRTSEIATNCLRLGYRDYTASGGNQTKLNAIYILGINGGYDSVYAEKEINLEEKLGLTSTELAGSYFENNSGVQTPITNFNEYIPTEAGKIVLVINAQGYASSTCVIEVIKTYAYNELETFSGELSESYLVANRDYPNDAYAQAVLSYENGGIKLDTTSMQQGNFLYNFKNVTADKYNKFDYIVIKGNVECTRDGFTIGLRENGSNVNDLENVKGDFTYIIPKEYFRSDYLQLQIRLWTGTADNKAKSIIITSITGGYNDIPVNETVNLVEKTGLTATELAGSYFENESGSQTPINDLTNFAPSEIGTIKLVINKQGYKANSEIIINVI